MSRRGLTLRRIFARNGRRLRLDRKLNQELLADAALLSQAQLSSIYSAKVNIRLDSLQRLATALGTRPADLLDDK